MLNSERLDRTFHHILATAALSEDFLARKLGPIHFLKYAYLGDLAYAERHEGEIFSGVEWRFYHFGPWSQPAFDELPDALERADAVIYTVQSRYENDFVRYGLDHHQAERLIRQTEHDLPFPVSNAIAQAVHEHGSDTASLLRAVYLTWPMLSARPGQVLSFRRYIEPTSAAPAETLSEQPVTRISKGERKTLIANARSEMARRLARPSPRIAPDPPPRYDEVFHEGTAFLDKLAGEPPGTVEGELTFDESIWQSDQRRDPDVS